MSAARASRRPTRAPTSITAEEHRAWAAAVAVVDRIAGDLERVWGVDRLPTLVSPDLAAKFARARQQCDMAIAAGDIDAAAQKAAALARGWQALDKARRHSQSDGFLEALNEAERFVHERTGYRPNVR